MDLRRHPRVPADHAPVRFASKGGEPLGDGFAKDVSLGGMFVVTEAPAAFNADIVVHLALPGADAELEIPARVRWTNRDGFGVQFGLIGVRETRAITEFVARKTR